MSLADATAALEGAIVEENSPPAGLTTVVPTEQAPLAPVTPEGGPLTPVQPDGQPRGEHGHFAPKTPAEPAPVEDTFSENVNPDTLAPELQQVYKQLQADYTRKTQEVAAQRAQFEQYGDPTQVTQAVELYRALQDPATLTQFHADLTQALQEQGLTPVQASAEAASQLEQAATLPKDGLDPRLAQLVQEYPDLAPLIEQTSQVSQLQSRLDAMDAERVQRQESEQLAYQQMALAGELQRQEMAITQSNPHYVQGDIDAIYELSAFFDGNLLQAQQRYEQIGQSLVDRYLSTKSAPSGVTPAPGTELASTQQPTEEMTLDQGYEAALAYAREAGLETIGA
jgi:hypothetical protein